MKNNCEIHVCVVLISYSSKKTRGCWLSKYDTCVIFTCTKEKGNFSKKTVTVQSGNIAHLRYFMPSVTSNI